jgi:hypothetical protein
MKDYGQDWWWRRAMLHRSARRTSPRRPGDEPHGERDGRPDAQQADDEPDERLLAQCIGDELSGGEHGERGRDVERNEKSQNCGRVEEAPHGGKAYAFGRG